MLEKKITTQFYIKLGWWALHIMLLCFFCGIRLAYRSIVVKSGLSEDDHLFPRFYLYFSAAIFNSINKHRIDLEKWAGGWF